MTPAAAEGRRNLAVVKTLTYLMFAMFAMTTDSVGLIIPEIVRTFRLTLTAAGTFQYATMAGIALAGLGLGTLADRLGHRRTIIAGLTLFAAACFLITTVNSFVFFAGLLGLSGIAIGVFKTGALALIGDLSSSTTEHTSIMNMLEGFFGIGAIIGPAVLARLLGAGLPWTRLYLLAGAICAILIVVASVVRYPETARTTAAGGADGTLAAWKNPYVLVFSAAAQLQATEAQATQPRVGQRCSRAIEDTPHGSRRTASRSSSRCAPLDVSWARGCSCGGGGMPRSRS
jgi:fucose permease